MKPGKEDKEHKAYMSIMEQIVADHRKKQEESMRRIRLFSLMLKVVLVGTVLVVFTVKMYLLATGQ